MPSWKNNSLLAIYYYYNYKWNINQGTHDALYTNTKSCDSAIVEAEKSPSVVAFQLVLGQGVLFHSQREISALCLATVSPGCDLWPGIHYGDSPPVCKLCYLWLIRTRAEMTHSTDSTLNKSKPMFYLGYLTKDYLVHQENHHRC